MRRLILRLLVYDATARTHCQCKRRVARRGNTRWRLDRSFRCRARRHPIGRRTADRGCRADRRWNADRAAEGSWCPTCRRNPQLIGRSTVDRADRTSWRLVGITRGDRRRAPGKFSTVRRERSIDRVSGPNSWTCQASASHCDSPGSIVDGKVDRGRDSHRRSIRLV